MRSHHDRAVMLRDFDGRFGWLYNAKQVADFEGISLDECFEKDVTSFLNYLIYLKAYSSHQEKTNEECQEYQRIRLS